MGLIYQTGKWADSLWAGHMKHSPHAKHIMDEGQRKQRRFPRLAEDVHASLYLKHEPLKQATAPEWATQLLEQSHDLAEWQTLRARCARNGFAAGVATETILEALLPLLPEQQKQKTAQNAPGSTHGTQPDPGQGQAGNTLTPDNAGAQRRALRQAMHAAQDAVEEAEASTQSMAEAMGLHAGTEPGHPETLRDLDQVRAMWALLRDHPTMRHIAEMAGRLQRLGQAHKRCQVTPAVGRIKGITVGGDLERLLPTELAGLRSHHRLQRLSTLGKIMEKRALQYEMQGEQSETRGPIIVLVDESGSMRGQQEQWSKAVCLALLATATQQKRLWFLAGFDICVTHEHHIEPGAAHTDVLLAALAMRASGGTAFDPPLTRALEVLRTVPTMRKADIILITDGEAAVSPEVAESVNQARKAESLHVYVIGIGGVRVKTLAPIADEIYHLSTTPADDSATIAPVIALVA